MSLQTTVAASSAFLLNMAGGAIAEHGWRAPYAVFAISLLLAPLMAVFLWEPRSRASMTAEQYGELLSVIGLATENNALMNAMRIPVDDAFKIE